MTIIYVALDLTKQYPQPQPIGHVILNILCQWHLVAIIKDLVGVELGRDFN